MKSDSFNLSIRNRFQSSYPTEGIEVTSICSHKKNTSGYDTDTETFSTGVWQGVNENSCLFDILLKLYPAYIWTQMLRPGLC